MREALAFLLLIFTVTSCSTLEPDKDFKRLDMNEFYREAGMSRYFLPAMPQWLNFSESAQCERSHSMIYLDMESLKKGQALNYEQSLQLQLLFNLSREEKMQTANVKALPLREEEGVFFESMQKIQSGFMPFMRPKFNRIHLVWIDSLLKSEENVKKLKKMMQGNLLTQGQAVFISQCMGKNEMEKFLEGHDLLDAHVRLIPMELFSVYSAEGKRQQQFLIELNQLFDTKQELHLFLMGQTKPKEFIGKFEVHP